MYMSDKKFTWFISIMKYLFLWEVGGCAYFSIECIWRGYSHWTMFVLGGVCLCIIGSINELILNKYIYMEYQVLLGDLVTIALEYCTGCIVNIGLGWNVWDYSDLPGNIMGQICPQFALLWMPIVAAAIYLDDWIRWKVFYQPMQPHIWFLLNIFKRKEINNNG